MVGLLVLVLVVEAVQTVEKVEEAPLYGNLSCPPIVDKNVNKNSLFHAGVTALNALWKEKSGK